MPGAFLMHTPCTLRVMAVNREMVGCLELYGVPGQVRTIIWG